MIVKGNARAGGAQLATHLLNAHDNERVEVAEITNSVSRNLHGAFAEWEAASTATNCKKYLYHLMLNPDPQQRSLTREEFYEYIARTEKTLGLADQPRIVVFHSKNGRGHCHVAWSRIDTDRLRAVQLSHDRQKLRTITRQFARDMGLQLPRGLQNDRGRDRFKDRARRSNHAEKQQEERTGIPKEARRAEITAAWRQSDTGQAFINALEQRGYTLAQGDSRGYVVVDRHGEIHSLSRQVEGVNAKQLAQRLAEFPPQNLPSAEQAKEAARQKNKLSLKEHLKLQADTRRAKLAAAHKHRRDELEKHRAVLLQHQADDMKALQERHAAEAARIATDRRDREPKGLAAFLARVTGIAAFRKGRQRAQDTRITTKQQRQVDALTRRHIREQRAFSRQESALSRVEKREVKSLETQLRREIFAQRQTTPRRDLDREQTAEQQRKAQQLRENAADIATAPQETAQKSGISDKFAEALKARAAQKKHDKTKSKGRSGERERDRGNDPSPH